MPDRDEHQPLVPAAPAGDAQPAAPCRRRPKSPPPPISPYPPSHPLYRDPGVSRVARLRSLARGEVVPGAPGGDTLYLRCLAGTHYVTSREKMTIEQLHEIDLFQHVPLKTLAHWSKEDKWHDNREKFFRALGQDLQERVRRHVGAAKVEQLRVMDRLFSRMAKKSDRLEPRSLETLAVAMCKVLEAANELRDQMAVSSMAVLSGESEEGEIPQMTDEQVREFALLATSQANRQLTDGQASTVTDAEGEPDGK